MLRKLKPRPGRQAFLPKKDIILSCASALLLALSFPVFNISFLAWAAFVPLFVSLENKSRFQSFALAYISGFVFWLGTIYWLVHVTAAGMFVLAMYLAFCWGFFGLLICLAGSLRKPLAVLFIPAVWVLLEYLRSYALTGFPWALVAYTQSQATALIQFSDITGAWGVSFLVLMVNAAAYIILSSLRSGKAFKKTQLVIACCVFLCAYIYGMTRISSVSRINSDPSRPVSVSVIQGNIPQEIKWDNRAGEYIMNTYSGLSRRAVADKPDLIVWPEAAVPAILSEGSDYKRGLEGLVSSMGVPLLTGAVTQSNGSYFNSAVLFEQNAPEQQYDKIHLVPFGEYIPLRSVFGFLETIVPIGEVQRGVDYRVFRLGGADNAYGPAFSVLICYEDAFPDISRRMALNGAQFLITVTNDAWYQRTSAPYQHFQASVFRAVENRMWMVRSANTGVSGFIRPDGTTAGIVVGQGGNAIFNAGYLTGQIRVARGASTVYTMLGDWFIAVALLIAVLCGQVFRAVQGARQHR